MTHKAKPDKTPVWRNSQQLRGVKAQLTAAVRQCTNGAYIELNIKSAHNLLEICDQAIHTEVGHELPAALAAEMDREYNLQLLRDRNA